jgi:hypothetical protein
MECGERPNPRELQDHPGAQHQGDSGVEALSEAVSLLLFTPANYYEVWCCGTLFKV